MLHGVCGKHEGRVLGRTKGPVEKSRAGWVEVGRAGLGGGKDEWAGLK